MTAPSVPQPPARRPVKPFVCGVPLVPGGRDLCGEPARMYPCGWRCERHRPGQRSVASEATPARDFGGGGVTGRPFRGQRRAM